MGWRVAAGGAGAAAFRARGLFGRGGVSGAGATRARRRFGRWGLFRARAHCLGSGAGVGGRGLTAWARAALRVSSGPGVNRTAHKAPFSSNEWQPWSIGRSIHSQSSSLQAGRVPDGRLAAYGAINVPRAPEEVARWRIGGRTVTAEPPPPDRPRRTVPAGPSTAGPSTAGPSTAGPSPPNRPRRAVTSGSSTDGAVASASAGRPRAALPGPRRYFHNTLPCVAVAQGNRRPGARFLERRGRPPHFAVNTIGISTQTGTSRVRFFAGAKRITCATSSAASSSAG